MSIFYIQLLYFPVYNCNLFKYVIDVHVLTCLFSYMCAFKDQFTQISHIMYSNVIFQTIVSLFFSLAVKLYLVSKISQEKQTDS